eukprot:SAG11_NODE_26223_length_348_cov_0.710843_1_plen_30_part_10
MQAPPPDQKDKLAAGPEDLPGNEMMGFESE